MSAKYSQLSPEERAKIESLRTEGLSRKAIARVLGRSQSTISRELSRNREADGEYGASQAQELALRRRRTAATGSSRMTKADWDRIDGLLRQGLSPERISGQLKQEAGQSVSATWIYKHVRRDQANGGELYRQLPHRGVPRR